jgi:ribosomal protein S26
MKTMRRGNISLGDIQCRECGTFVPHSERYLALEEQDGAEVEEGGETVYYCVECAVKKGYAHYKEEKDERVLTFFTDSEL